MDNTKYLSKQFEKIFNSNSSPRIFFAPGRINLIGEHTDYNGGHVFPASISLGTYAAAQKRDDHIFRFYSLNIAEQGIIECSMSDLSYNASDDWANYPKGMIQLLMDAGYEINSGADILYYGNIPNGAGLSSSASIELVTGVTLEGLYDLTINRIEMVKIGQKVENHYIGVNSGIMDQFTVGMGKTNHAILLNCDTLEFQYAPLELNNHTIMIINTNKHRSLADTKYNERRAQCECALSDLQTELEINSLGELGKKDFDLHQYLIKDDINRKRAKHAVYENARTLEALAHLQQGNLQAFGKLMNESHQSLQYDYEVTGLELDTIVQAAWQQEGVLGARMTGAGFGGCAIAIVEKIKVESFQDHVYSIYKQKTGREASFYPATLGDGAKEILLKEANSK